MLEMIINRTFEGQVSPLHSNESTSVVLSDPMGELIKFDWDEDQLIQLTARHDIPLHQAIYIESPYIFQFMNIYQMARRGSRLYRKSQFSKVPNYIHDLLQKMIVEHLDTDSVVKKIVDSGEKRKLKQTQEALTYLIGGEMLFDQKADEFLFSANNIKEPIKMANGASGIKSLSILQKLLKNGWLNELTVLIIDEPENHLHPKWQVRKFICFHRKNFRSYLYQSGRKK